jgi:hypothetical protein
MRSVRNLILAVVLFTVRPIDVARLAAQPPDHSRHTTQDDPQRWPGLIMLVPAPPYHARIDIAPAQLGTNTITVRLSFDGVPGVLDALEVKLELALPTGGVGPLSRLMTREGPGVFRYTGPGFSVTGTWQLRIEALVNDAEKAVFEKSVELP